MSEAAVCEDYKLYSKKSVKDFNILTYLYQCYTLFIVFLPFFVFPFYKFELVGDRKKLPKKPVIIAPNHISYYDVFIAFWVFRRPIAYMAKKELFNNSNWKRRYITRNILRLGAFPVNREKLEKSTIKTSKDAIAANFRLCIFPQGGIRKNKKIEEINKGFAIIAKMTKVDIVPVAISGLEEYNWSLFKRPHVKISIGETISHELEADEIIENWRRQVAKMADYELC